MSYSSKILGQAKPAALQNQTLFSVSSSNSVECTIFINNQGPIYDGYSIALIQANGTQTPASQLALNTQLAGGTTVAFSGIYLGSDCSVVVSSSLGFCAFTATGLDFSS